jgi:hypothetical protein
LVNGLEAYCHVPDGHVWARDLRKANGSRETLVTLGIIVFKADLKLDGLEEIPLFGLERVLQELLDIGTHSGCGQNPGQP